MLTLWLIVPDLYSVANQCQQQLLPSQQAAALQHVSHGQLQFQQSRAFAPKHKLPETNDTRPGYATHLGWYGRILEHHGTMHLARDVTASHTSPTAGARVRTSAE